MLIVLRVVSQTTQQFGHSDMCASRCARVSGSTDSSRYSLSSFMNSLQVSKSVTPFAPEMARQLLPQLQPRAQQPAFYGRHGKVLKGECATITQALGGS